MPATLTTRRGLDLTVHDEFCGAGGFSDGVHAAGATVTLAVNHNPLAIESHAANFPDTAHDCRDVRTIDPGFYPAADILIASPECKSHTYAGGRKNLDQEPLFESAAEKKARLTAIRSRATMDQVVRWIRQHRYQAAIIENVGEVVDWSGFDAWLKELDKLGYDVQFCWFNSMFFGGQVGDLDLTHPPQSRDRLYMVLSRKGNPKPDVQHRPRARCFACDRDVDAVQSFTPGRRRPMRYRRQYIYTCPTCGAEAFPYVAPAAAAIDWSLPTPLIGDRKRPLKPATMARIAAGLERYGYWPGSAMAVATDHTSRQGTPTLKAARSVDDQPMPGQTGRQELGLATTPPLVVTNRTNGHAHPAASDPLTTMTTGENHLLITDRQHTTARTIAGDPLTGVTGGGNHHHLLDPAFVVANYSSRGRVSGWTRDARTNPGGSITSADSHALLIPTNGQGGRRARPDSEPLPTQTADAERAVLVPYDGAARPPTWPLPTQTSVQGDGMVVPAGGSWSNTPTTFDQPLPTQLGRESRGIVRLPSGLIVQVGGNTFERQPGAGGRVRPVHWPLRAQTGTSSDGLVTIPESFLKPYRAQVPWAELGKQGIDSFPPDVLELIMLCGWRMFTWQEIRSGMAFRPDYVVLGTSRQKIALLGQAVTPPVTSWLFDRVAASLAPR